MRGCAARWYNAGYRLEENPMPHLIVSVVLAFGVSIAAAGCSLLEEVTTPPAAVPDTTGPAIDYIIQEPNGRRVPQNVPIEISVDVRDPSGIAGVALKTSPDGELVMTPDGLGSYRISVPPHNLQTVTYSIVAEDLLGNTSTSAAYQFFQNG